VLLAGHETLLTNLRGKSGEHGYLYSRVGGLVRLGEITVADVRVLLEANLPTAVDMAETMHRCARGNARTLNKMMRHCHRQARFSGCDVDKTMVERVAKMLMV
jgi:DNA transposition AAA+ family ATPase